MSEVSYIDLESAFDRARKIMFTKEELDTILFALLALSDDLQDAALIDKIRWNISQKS